MSDTTGGSWLDGAVAFRRDRRRGMRRGVISAKCLSAETQKCENSPIRMMIGMGTPIIQRSMERMIGSVAGGCCSLAGVSAGD